jgi:hypothetical protein
MLVGGDGYERQGHVGIITRIRRNAYHNVDAEDRASSEGKRSRFNSIEEVLGAILSLKL